MLLLELCRYPLIFFCPADNVPNRQPRILLDVVDARSVNANNTHSRYVCERVLFVNGCFYLSLSRDGKSV